MPIIPYYPTMKTRIGILTGRGDCPGLNAVIRAVVIAEARGNFDRLGLRALVVVGGDGSLSLA